MSKVTTPNTKKQPATCFKYRNFKKDFNKPYHYSNLSAQKHLELGEHNEVVIVEDRPTDWTELVNNNVDKVGLVNVLELARRRGDSIAKFAFDDKEALDLSDMDPMNPDSINKVIAGQEEAANKLAGIAQQLGVSVDDLIKSFMSGTFNDLVASKAKTEEKKEGEENA